MATPKVRSASKAKPKRKDAQTGEKPDELAPLRERLNRVLSKSPDNLVGNATGISSVTLRRFADKDVALEPHDARRLDEKLKNCFEC